MHHLMESFSRIFMSYHTPPTRVSHIYKPFYDMKTCIVQQPVAISNRRRGPDDYTPVNLRHAFEDEFSDECSNRSMRSNKKNN